MQLKRSFVIFPEAVASLGAKGIFHSGGQGELPSAHIFKNCQWDVANFLAQVDIVH